LPKRKYKHQDRAELYDSLDLDYIGNYFTDWSGQAVKLVSFRAERECDKYVLVTKKKTVNKDMVLLNLYWRDQRVFGVRVSKETYSMIRVNDAILAFYSEYLHGK
jgi:hypothetical protein